MKKHIKQTILIATLALPSNILQTPWITQNKEFFWKQIHKELSQENNSMHVKKQSISFDEALLLSKIDATNTTNQIIYYVSGSVQPFDYWKEYPKHYLFRHGSATDDIWLIKAWYKKANFAYAILKNWVILQFFDDTKGSGAIWWFGAVDNNALSNLQWIWIEFSAAMNKSWSDVEEPNTYQLNSALFLKKYLSSIHTIKKNHTSRQAVQNTPDIYEQELHFDTKTRSEKICNTLGIDTLDNNIYYTINDIKEKLEMSEKLEKNGITQDKNKQYFEHSKEYRKSLLKNNSDSIQKD